MAEHGTDTQSVEDSGAQVSALAVIVVMYRSADVIAACLRSMLNQRADIGRIVLVDNCCPAQSAEEARNVAAELNVPVHEASSCTPPPAGAPCIELIRSDRNLGFAGGVNLGMKLLLKDSRCQYFWVLNPDCELTSGCAGKLLASAQQADREGGFSLLGSRIVYHGADQIIQSDGGICNTWTGRCSNRNQGRRHVDVRPPNDARIDFISGASMIASRRFLERVGLMPEHYFLYYEEVAWAQERGDLPLVVCKDAIVQHHGGTSIGSGSHDRLPSPLSNFFNFRNRIRFIAEYHPLSLPACYGFSLMKIMQTVAKGGWHTAVAAFRGLHGLSPPAQVRDSFGVEEHATAFRSSTDDLLRVSRSDQRRVA